MKVTLTRSQAQKLIDQIDENYRLTAEPLLPDLSKKLKEAKESRELAHKKFFDLYNSDSFQRVLPFKRYDSNWIGYCGLYGGRGTGFTKGQAYEDLKILLESTDGDCYHVSVGDVEQMNRYGTEPYTEKKFRGIFDLMRIAKRYEDDYNLASEDLREEIGDGKVYPGTTRKISDGVSTSSASIGLTAILFIVGFIVLAAFIAKAF